MLPIQMVNKLLQFINYLIESPLVATPQIYKFVDPISNRSLDTKRTLTTGPVHNPIDINVISSRVDFPKLRPNVSDGFSF